MSRWVEIEGQDELIARLERLMKNPFLRPSEQLQAIRLMIRLKQNIEPHDENT